MKYIITNINHGLAQTESIKISILHGSYHKLQFVLQNFVQVGKGRDQKMDSIIQVTRITPDSFPFNFWYDDER